MERKPCILMNPTDVNKNTIKSNVCMDPNRINKKNKKGNCFVHESNKNVIRNQ